MTLMTIPLSPQPDAPLTAQEIAKSTKLFEIKPGMLAPISALSAMLPDVETALFFAKAYQLDFHQLSELIRLLFQSDMISALLGEGHEHSTELQDYLIDTVPDHVWAQHGQAQYSEEVPVPDTELLAQLFESVRVEVAKSIQDVADKLGSVLAMMPSKFGTMTFQHLHKLNAQRNSIGTYEAVIEHEQTPARLVVLDVSGSMTAGTVHRIVDEVVGLAYAVNASLAIVSNNAFLWEAGTFDANTVLDHAEYGGTHYEMLAPIFDQDWETVITIADYDSSWAAQDYLARTATGRVNQVLDISLVNRPTFLSECVGRLANEVKPLLIGTSRNVLQ